MSDYNLQQRQTFAIESIVKLIERLTNAVELNNVIMSQALAIMKEESLADLNKVEAAATHTIAGFKTEILDEV